MTNVMVRRFIEEGSCSYNVRDAWLHAGTRSGFNDVRGSLFFVLCSRLNPIIPRNFVCQCQTVPRKELMEKMLKWVLVTAPRHHSCTCRQSCQSLRGRNGLEPPVLLLHQVQARPTWIINLQIPKVLVHLPRRSCVHFQTQRRKDSGAASPSVVNLFIWSRMRLQSLSSRYVVS
jgi:hypothetical protein